MNQHELVSRTENAFHRAFGAKAQFDCELSRSNDGRWTSLKHVEFLVALEKEFGVRFDGADATDMTSIPAVIECVTQKLS